MVYHIALKLREKVSVLSDSRSNVIRYECGQVVAELEPDSEGVLKIKKIIERK